MERVWAVGVMKGSNSVCFGFDEGVAVVKIGGCQGLGARVLPAVVPLYAVVAAR